jgi:hypothetical protein
MTDAMRWAADFVYNVVDYWPEWTWSSGQAADPKHPNQFNSAPNPGAITSEAVFGNSMDFLYRNVSYAPSRTAVDPDGRIRLVLTGQDPGYWNWIDNQGYTAGALSFRNVRANALPDITSRVVKLAELAGQMHAGSRKASEADRTAQLQRRFDAILRRYKLG